MYFVDNHEVGGCRFWARLVAGWLSVLLLSGCAAVPGAVSSGGDGDQTTSAQTTSAQIETDISPELLYELLLANVATQRGHDKAAMESLARAAYLSRDQRVVGWAIQLAVQQENHARVIELSDLMKHVAPPDIANNAHHQLTLANAQFNTAQPEQAIETLVDLARMQQFNQEAVLQSIAALLAKQSPPQILQQFRNHIETLPPSPELTLTAALLAHELKHPALEELIEQTLLLRPDWEIAASLKLIHLTDVAPTQMPIYANAYLRKHRNAQRFRIRYGELLLYTEQPKKSLAQLKIALKQDPQSVGALFSSGLAYLQQENYPKALEQLQKYLVLQPQNELTRLYIASVYIEQKNFAAAEVVLRAVISQKYYVEAQVRLASVISKQRGVEAGIRHLDIIRARNEGEMVHVILAQELLYRDFNMLERAKDALDAGLKRLPNKPELLYNRGLLAAELNLLELHERDLRAVIAQQPNNAHAYNALGYTLADKTKRLDEAFELIRKALELMPNDPLILDSMGWVNFRRGENDKAIEFLRRAFALKQDAEIAAHLGEALWVGGKQREAKKIWAQGKKSDADNVTLLETIGRFSRKQSSGIDVFEPQLVFAPAPINR